MMNCSTCTNLHSSSFYKINKIIIYFLDNKDYNRNVTRKEVNLDMDKRKYGSNIHILDEKVIQDFEDKYDVTIADKFIVFMLTYQDCNKCYPIGKKFNVMTKDKTKLTIQPLAVDYWREQDKYSIFRIQNAINKLIIFNQEPTYDNITKLLEEK